MRNLKFWFPFLGYSGIIFLISSLPADRVVFTRFFWDKFLHTIEYLPLGVFAAYGLKRTSSCGGFFLWFSGAAICFAYGLSDEFHQSFVPGRESNFMDAVADFCGGIIGSGLYVVAIRCFRKKDTHGSY